MGLYDFENQWMPKTAILVAKAFIFLLLLYL